MQLRKSKLTAFLVAYALLFSQQAMAQGLGGGIFGGSVRRTGDTMTGPLLVPDGALATPSIAFASDADGSGTGFYRESANAIGFVMNGTALAAWRTTFVRLGSGYAFNWGSAANANGGSNDTGLVRNAAAIVEVTNGTSGWGSLKTGRLITGGSTPSVAVASGFGTSPSAAVDTGSGDTGGIITITNGTGGVATGGTITVTFSNTNGAYATNNPAVIVVPMNGTSSWNSRATAVITAASTTAFTVSLENNAAALTASGQYKFAYHVIGK